MTMMMKMKVSLLKDQTFISFQLETTIEHLQPLFGDEIIHLRSSDFCYDQHKRE